MVSELDAQAGLAKFMLSNELRGAKVQKMHAGMQDTETPTPAAPHGIRVLFNYPPAVLKRTMIYEQVVEP